MEDYEQIKKAFDDLDLLKEGLIPRSQIQDALKNAEVDPKEEDYSSTLKTLGLENVDFIDFEQFRQIVKQLYKLELKGAFKVFAQKGCDYILPDTLREIVKPILGTDIKEKELDRMIEDADADKDGTIDIDEFVDFMMTNVVNNGE